MVEVGFVVVVLALCIVLIVALNVAAARLRSRVISWTFGRVTRSMSWMSRPGALGDDSGAGVTNELASIFGPADGPRIEAAGSPDRTGAGPVKSRTVIENLEERDHK